MEERQALEEELIETEEKIWYFLGLKPHSVVELFELLGRDITHISRHDITTQDFREAADVIYNTKLEQLRRNGVVSERDVDGAINRISEVPFRVWETIARGNVTDREIKAKFHNSGHLITAPAGQVLIKIPTNGWGHTSVLFSGDRWNSQLQPPYAQADDEGLENSADILVLEATYWWKIHRNRESALEKLDEIIISAVKKGEDIIFPIISLDRPLIVMYEIVMRLIKTWKINPQDVDIFYFWRMIGELLPVGQSQPMLKEIKKYWREFDQSRIGALSESTGKTRIIFAWGWFLPRGGSPAGAILEEALEQEEITIIFTNYHGEPWSNAANLLAGKEFDLTRENPEPHILTAWQKWHYIPGFSGHDDGPGLVAYARKVVRDGATIYLNHGTEESRQALALLMMRDEVLMGKWVTVVLPKVSREYAIKIPPHKRKKRRV
jgi:predicted metal-dependent RNase